MTKEDIIMHIKHIVVEQCEKERMRRLTMYEEEKYEIVRCENGVGEWEISPIWETFDTRGEAEQRLKDIIKEEEEA